jgi:hypothetical protein
MAFRGRKGWRWLAASLGGLVVAGGGCSKKSEQPPGPTCSAGERVVGTACVRAGFFESDLAPTAAGLLAVEAGVFYTRETLIIMLRDPLTSRQAAGELFSRHGGRVVGAAPFIGFYQVRFADAPTGAALDARRAALQADPAVELAMRDIGLPNSLAADPRPLTPLERLTPASVYQAMWDEQDEAPPKLPIGPDGTWAWTQVGFPGAWDSIHAWNPRPRSVTVAILDGDLRHDPVFGPTRFVSAGDHRPADGKERSQRHEQHATAVASIVAAPNDDKRLLGGMATGLACLQADLSPQVVAFKFGLDDPANGVSQASALVRGLIAAVRAGARVINTSAGLSLPAAEARSAADLARVTERLCAEAPDVVFVFSAGNDSMAGMPFDAANHVPSNAARTARNAISVGATERAFVDGSQQEVPATSSNVDPQNSGVVTIAAPGRDVLTLLPDGGLTKFNGTSAAAPLVAGAAALLLQLDPRLSGGDVRTILLDTADPLPRLSPISGRRLAVRNAVDRVLAGLPAKDRGQGTCRKPDPAPAATDAGGFVPSCLNQGFCGSFSLCPPGKFWCRTSSRCHDSAEELLKDCASASCLACQEPPVPWCTSDECKACAESGRGLWYCPADKSCTNVFNDYAVASCPVPRCTCRN